MMNSLKQIFFNVIVVGVVAHPLYGLAVPDSPKAYIDMHYHFSRSGEGYGRQARIPEKDFEINSAKGLVEKQLLISESYINPDFLKNDLNENSKEKENNIVSEFTKSHPGTYGLCGINFIWKDYLDVAKKCLSLSGMIGVKLHLMRGWAKSFDNEELASHYSIDSVELTELLKYLNEKPTLLLVHYPGHPFQRYESLDGFAEKLLRIVVKYPNVKFIIAHTGYQQYMGYDGMKKIGQFFRDHPEFKRNVYTDTSAVLMSASIHSATERPPVYGTKSNSFLRLEPLPTNEEIQKMWQGEGGRDTMSTWKEFGMDYILFGSDFPFYDQETEIRTITENPFLSATEKNKILRENAKNLLKEIGR